jgi:hypothetical protein
MPTIDDAIRIDAERAAKDEVLLASNADLRQDKNRLYRQVNKSAKEARQLQQTLDSLRTENAAQKAWVRLQQDTKISREIGTLILTVCGVVAPLIPISDGWLRIAYYCAITGALVFIGHGVYYGRVNSEK